MGRCENYFDLLTLSRKATKQNCLIIPEISVCMWRDISEEPFILSPSHLACVLLVAKGSALLTPVVGVDTHYVQY